MGLRKPLLELVAQHHTAVYKILQFFLDNPGRIIDARTLYEGVWKDKYLPSSTNTVMVHILNLRKKLEADYTNPKWIRTVWGKGYQID